VSPPRAPASRTGRSASTATSWRSCPSWCRFASETAGLEDSGAIRARARWSFRERGEPGRAPAGGARPARPRPRARDSRRAGRGPVAPPPRAAVCAKTAAAATLAAAVLSCGARGRATG
jgi:hypothetical protein